MENHSKLAAALKDISDDSRHDNVDIIVIPPDVDHLTDEEKFDEYD